MADRSDVILERLTKLHSKLIDLTLDRTERLLGVLGRPEEKLPPIFHIAGTNGKGSVSAYLRAGLAETFAWYAGRSEERASTGPR